MLALPFLMEEYKQSYENWLAGRPHLKDIWIIYPMLKPPPEKLYKELLDTVGGDPYKLVSFHYGCKHLTEDKKCSIYDARPQMCRTFPDDHPCQFCGVTA
jgi:Fe-S-cluster containining protein